MNLSQLFRHTSIEVKLRIIVFTATLTGLLLAGVGISIYDHANFKQRFATQLVSQADLIANNVKASILYDDNKQAEEILRTFSAIPSISNVRLFDNQYKPVASFIRNDSPNIMEHPVISSTAQYHYANRRLYINHPIRQDHEIIGYLHLQANINPFYQRLINNLSLVLMIVPFALIFAFIVASRLQKNVSTPLHQLSHLMERVSSSQDYSIRATRQSNDDIGVLVSHFNAMLEKIETHQKKLRRHSVELEIEVTNRTLDLENSNEELTDTVARLQLAQHQLQEEKERAQVTLHCLSEAIISCDATGHINYMNPAAEMLTAWMCEKAIGTTIHKVMVVTDLENQQDYGQMLLSHTVSPDDDCHIPLLQLTSRDGVEYIIETSLASLQHNDRSLTGSVIVFRDVSEAHSMREQISYQATHDALTGLANRYQFNLLLKELIKDAKSHYTSHIICYLDLDNFKTVNDSAGHPAGDQLLQSISNILKQSISQNDTVSRVGGDEFGMLMRGKDVDSAMLVSNKILEAIRDFRFIWDDSTYQIGVSIGIAPITATTNNASEVQQQADTALYEAKNNGKNQVAKYSPYAHRIE